MKKLFFSLIFIFILTGFCLNTPVWAAENLPQEFWHQTANCLSKGSYSIRSPYDQHEVRFCGTPYLVPLADPELEVPEDIMLLVGRPRLQESYETPEGHFKIHYCVTGDSAVLNVGVDEDPEDGVPDYVNFVGDVCEFVWERELEDLAYLPPPSDSFYSQGDGAAYDIYIMDLSDGLFGWTAPDSVVTYPTRYTSFIALDNDYSWFSGSYTDAIKVTMAHEFFHAVQFGYDLTEYQSNPYSSWWLEGSAVWMEEQVYDEINDYLNFLPDFFENPHLSLTETSELHMYASCVWPIFLSEKFETDIIKKIWTLCAEVSGYNVLSATDEVLYDPSNDYKSSFNEAFAEFATWNYFTGSRSGINNGVTTYSEAVSYPEIPDDVIRLIQVYPDTVMPGSEYPDSPEHLATNYIKFSVYPDSLGGLWFGFDGREELDWEVALVAANLLSPGYTPEVSYFELNQDYWGTDTILSWNRYSDILMIPCAISDTTLTLNASYAYAYGFDTTLVTDLPVYGDVWPGDLDNNGTVEAADILPLAYYWQLTGYPRGTVSYSWEGYQVQLWITPAASYADADGNGVVEITDFLPICLNWGATHTQSSQPPFVIDDFDIENHRQALESIYTQVAGHDTGAKGEIRHYLEGLLNINIPGKTSLFPCYPNPFNSNTSIRYRLAKECDVQLTVYNLAGQKVKTLVNQPQSAGEHEIVWDGGNGDGEEISSGIYFYHLKAADYSNLRKMTLLK
ncbi:MAG: T9SS type A sorting domain-containing protein [candidate division Zixibacteria bacterium]|nr:T9SS type A sorting domain-containing protein [candidate division Zixibacteria bacterium]